MLIDETPLFLKATPSRLQQGVGALDRVWWPLLPVLVAWSCRHNSVIKYKISWK
jgi:hypothetical protein